jgi:hypothetical protein
LIRRIINVFARFIQCESVIMKTIGNRLRKIEHKLVPCSTETGELESENWVGVPS